MGKARNNRIMDVCLPLSEVEFYGLFGLEVELRQITIDDCLIVNTIWRTSNCKHYVTLSWQKVIKSRKSKFSISMYSNNELCGLMAFGYSKSRINLNLRYIEANPREHVLKRTILELAIIIVKKFAEYICTKSISKPDIRLIDRYKELGFKLTSNDTIKEKKGKLNKVLIMIMDI